MECTDSPPKGRELSILFTGDKEIRELNARYRKKDKATDVLSFPLDDETMLGDVVISVETAAKQAKSYRTTFRAEITRLLIHGVLHLLGHDHEGVSKAKAEKMRRLERSLAAQLR